MTDNPDNIEYSGPNRKFQPGPGGNAQARWDQNLSEEANGGYDNIDWLEDLLTFLIALTTNIIDEFEDHLNKTALRVSDETRDDKLRSAYKAEWPEPTSTPPNFIPYSYYKSLATRSTAGSQYIRQRWEEAARDVSGDSRFDLVGVADTMRSEAFYIKEFLDTYVGTVNDSSEKRTVELFQDWATSAIQRAQRIQTFGRSEEVQLLPATEVDATNAQDAAKYQAVLKIRLNELNKRLVQQSVSLKKNYADYSNVFYNKFLGPSLKFRIDVSRQLYPSSTQMGTELGLVKGRTDAMFENHLTDQLRRNSLFNGGVDSILTTVAERDKYRDYIVQLTIVGKALAAKDTLVTVSASDLEDFPELVDDSEHATPVFDAPHNMLSGRDHPDAHPGLLSRSGGVMTGDITLDPGVKIDGVVPKEHRHRGLDVDGTPKIKGSDIEDLVTSSIDRNEEICTPSNLRNILNKPSTGSNNVTLINSLIAWECDPRFTFEVQMVPVGTGVTPPAAVAYCVSTLTETNEDIVGLASDLNFVSYATSSFVGWYNWQTQTGGTVAGVAGDFGDAVGPGAATRFYGIGDITQDFYDGRLYIADTNNHKLKMTTAPTANGFTGSVAVSTMYQSQYPIRRVDSQGQNFMNTLYTIEGPTFTGLDRVVRLTDNDGNNNVAGAFSALIISKLSETYANLKDIAVASNGFVYLLTADDKMLRWDPNTDSLTTEDVVADNPAHEATAITCDHAGGVLITYSSDTG